MASNCLLLSHQKTDLLWCSRGGSQAASELILDGSPVQPSSHVRDLGVQFDDDLLLKKHADQLTGRCYSQLRRIRSCRRAMMHESAKTVVNSLVVSKVDCCNSLLAACIQAQTDKLQRVLNCAARVILGGSKYDNVTPLIRDDLHWLRVPEHIMFKLCLLAYKALHGLAPVYIKSLCVPVSSSIARSLLRSASRGHLIVPCTRLEFSKRAFAFAGLTAWNSLPDIIRSTESINTFKRLLKSFLFSVSYPGLSFSVTACYTSSLC